jgi:hypothetical protein
MPRSNEEGKAEAMIEEDGSWVGPK